MNQRRPPFASANSASPRFNPSRTILKTRRRGGRRETLGRIYIGRRFKNDTERLEKLFEMYTKMTKRN